jgi:cyanophycinase
VSIHLVGGGRADTLDDPGYAGEIYRPFIAEAAVRAAGAGRMLPRIRIVLVDGDAEMWASLMKRAAACDPVVTELEEGGSLSSGDLTDIDGLLVGGGLTPAYYAAVIPLADEIRLLVQDGLPYLGFSAGAAIAADTAILGGWKIGDLAIASDAVGEDLEELTVAEGLALVDVAIDVHAAQWGTLTRLIAATEAGMVEGGIAIDEFTLLVVGDDGFRVEGAGNVWQVEPTDDGSVVRLLGA